MNLLKSVSFLVFLIISTQAYSAVTSQVDRASLQQGETLLLILNVTDTDFGSIDLTPLKENFEVLDRNHRSNTEVIAGRIKNTIELLITLAPKSIGALEIPRLTVSGEQTKPILIVVSPAEQVLAVDGGIELHSIISDETLLAYQPLTYQVKVLHGQQIFDSTFLEPKVKRGKASIQIQGEPREYREQVQGKEILIVEQSWVIVPQQSGPLEIESAKLSAAIRKKQMQLPASGDGEIMQRIYLKGDDYHFDIGSIPKTYSGSSWITASKITLNASLSNDEWKVAEPLTRTITLNAIDSTAKQISELQLPDAIGLKQYSSKPVFKTDFKDGRVEVQMTVDVTLIPSRVGEVALPEIRLPWWNTQTNQEEVTILPGQRFHVVGNNNATENTDSVLPFEQKNQANSSQANNGLKQVKDRPGFLTKVASYFDDLVFYCVALFSCLLSFYLLRRYTISIMGRSSEFVARSIALRQLKMACRNNDAVSAKKLLKACMHYIHPETMHLNVKLDKLSPEFKAATTELNRCCYAAHKSEWSGAELLKLIEGCQIKAVHRTDIDLVGLVPHRH